MEFSSHDFENGAILSPAFTCDGQDFSPHLAWSGAPEATKSFALRCFDPDAPGSGFVHWLMVNIPAAVNHIPQGGPIPAGAVEIENDFGKTAYGGPCPPSGVHRYEFTVFALDIEQLSGLTAENFLHQVEAHTISRATLMGRYQRQ